MIKVASGDYPEGSIITEKQGVLLLVAPGGNTAEFEEVNAITVVDEKTRREWGRKAMVGVGVGLLTGGVGLLAGGLLAGNNKDMILLVELPEGKNIIVQTDKKGHSTLRAFLPKGDLPGSDIPFMQAIHEKNREEQARKKSRPPAGIIPGVNG